MAECSETLIPSSVPTATPSRKVLILSRRPLEGALLGMMLELEHLEPAFVEPGERAEDAVTRVRPLLVIPMDGEDDMARSDLFLARATKRGVRVVLFSPPDRRAEVEEVAKARGLPCISLPLDRSTIVRLIGDRVQVTRTGRDRRRRPDTARTADGTLIYEDDRGRRWLVYERRGTDRRRAASSDPAGPPPGEAGYRIFVNDAGEEWRYPIPAGHVLPVTAAALQEQLARAVKLAAPESPEFPELPEAPCSTS